VKIKILPNTEYRGRDERCIIGKELEVVREYPNYYLVLYEPRWSKFGELAWYIKKDTARVIQE